MLFIGSSDHYLRKRTSSVEKGPVENVIAEYLLVRSDERFADESDILGYLRREIDAILQQFDVRHFDHLEVVGPHNQLLSRVPLTLQKNGIKKSFDI